MRHASITQARAVRAAALALTAAVALAIAAAGSPASARYELVGGGLVQWEWVPATSTEHQITDVVVRPDGWLVVATAARFDGHLHLVPPWGGGLSDHTRFGPTDLGFRQLEVRGGRLYGLRQETLFESIEDPPPRPLAPAELYELDLASGAVLRHLGEWWNQDLAMDPRTDELVLQALGPEEPYDHDVVRFNPDTGSVTVLVPDSNPHADDAREIAFTPDGELLLLGERTGSAVDVHRRNGQHLYRMRVGQLDAMAFGRPGTCLAGQLLITRFDGTVLSVVPGPAATPRPLASGGRAAAISYAALGTDGNLLTARLHDVTLLACPPFEPPQPPVALPPSPPPVPPGPEVAGAVAPAGTAPSPPGLAASPAPPAPPPPAPPGAPPPAPPAAAPMATPTALGGAAQASAAPSAVAADAPDEEHVTSLAASALAASLVLPAAGLAMGVLAYAATTGSASPVRAAAAAPINPSTPAATRRPRR